jgi:hypothetical protein
MSVGHTTLATTISNSFGISSFKKHLPPLATTRKKPKILNPNMRFHPSSPSSPRSQSCCLTRQALPSPARSSSAMRAYPVTSSMSSTTFSASSSTSPASTTLSPTLSKLSTSSSPVRNPSVSSPSLMPHIDFPQPTRHKDMPFKRTRKEREYGGIHAPTSLHLFPECFPRAAGVATVPH